VVIIRHANLLSYVCDTVEIRLVAGPEDAPDQRAGRSHCGGGETPINQPLRAGAARSVILEAVRGAHGWPSTPRTQSPMQVVVPNAGPHRHADDKTCTCQRRCALSPTAAPRCRAGHRARLRAWPEVDFVNAYGLTRTSSTIAVLSPEDHPPRRHCQRRRPCGPASTTPVTRASLCAPSIRRDDDAIRCSGPGWTESWVRGAQILSVNTTGIGSRLTLMDISTNPRQTG